MTKLRYERSHWSREQDAEAALQQYLVLGEKPFNRTKSQLLESLAGDVRGKRILDYGGGAGIMAIPFAKAGATVTIVDAEANGLKTACLYAHREHVAEQVTAVHSEHFPQELKSERFDVVVAKDIIEHIEDDQAFLNDLALCQQPGDVLLLSTQNSRSLNYVIEGSFHKYVWGNPNWCGWDKTHLRFYTSSSLAGKLRRAGYRPVAWASVYIVPYNILKWLTVQRVGISIPALRYIDLSLGRVFPFNRVGWNILVRAVRLS